MVGLVLPAKLAMNRTMSRIFLCLLACIALFPSNVKAQTGNLQNQWLLHRHELSFSGGVSNFLGDLGGRDRIGSDFIYDLEKTLFKTSFAVDYRYYLAKHVILRQSIAWHKVAGDDKLTAEPFRNNRNLNFQSHIFEYDMMMEFQFMSMRDHERHGLKNHSGRRIGWRYRSIGGYFFGGIGTFYFNPTSTYYGSKVKLHEMHTEGQGLPDGPKQYKRMSVSVPVGMGFRMAINRQWYITLEGSYRFTFTDYIDDVSGYYYDNQAIADNYGIAAAYMANPSLQNAELIARNGYDPTNAGYQRGDPTDKDGYMTATIGVHYRFRNKYNPYGGSVKRNNRPYQGKRRMGRMRF
jgi:hypothetical protein